MLRPELSFKSVKAKILQEEETVNNVEETLLEALAKSTR